jgi:DNA-binding GntR family transcriptional regulator
MHREITARLRDMIIEGELAPDVRMPEQTLCAQLGISRTPLREALKALAAEGLIELLPNRGAVVARLTVADAEEIFQVLAALEVLGAALAAARIGDAEVAEIAAQHYRMVAHYKRGELMAYFKLNQAIHEAIIAASHNKALTQTYRTLNARIARARYMGNLKAVRWEAAVKEHEEILAALAARDASRLTTLMREHLRAGWEVVKTFINAKHGAAQ